MLTEKNLPEHVLDFRIHNDLFVTNMAYLLFTVVISPTSEIPKHDVHVSWFEFFFFEKYLSCST
jgi:hypothetical protein